MNNEKQAAAQAEPLHALHERIERHCAKNLKKMDFTCISRVYHDALPAEEADLLKKDYSMTALYLRSASDRIALGPFTFKWDVKTHTSTDNPNATIELTPLMFYLDEAKRGVKTAIFYYDQPKNDIRAWWVQDLAPVKVVIPKRWSAAEQQHFKAQALDLWPGVEVQENAPVRGSGDPFCIFAREDIEKCPLPSKLIASAIEQAGAI